MLLINRFFDNLFGLDEKNQQTAKRKKFPPKWRKAAPRERSEEKEDGNENF